MALFPQDRRTRRREGDEDRLLSRWPVFAAALLIAALFGLLSGVVKDVQFPRGVQSADKGSDTPHFSKREPLRALAAAERRDGTGAHAAGNDGAILPHSVGIAFPVQASALWLNRSHDPSPFAFWPGSLPRAPPLRG